uniref:DUF4326 domain-containing protein n=1 Tax=viral metagenome TaxID=1070528 RepID=A0A6C0C8E1_9ZZZZ
MEETTIVNVKVAFIRPTYKNLSEWMDDPNNVYIGRAGIVFIDGKRFPRKSSEWCNPFKITKDLTRASSLRKYRKHLIQMLEDEDCLERFRALRGKNLGCWCKPTQCHGDIIIKLLDEIE